MRKNIVRTNPNRFAPMTCLHWLFNHDMFNFDRETKFIGYRSHSGNLLLSSIVVQRATSSPQEHRGRFLPNLVCNISMVRRPKR